MRNSEGFIKIRDAADFLNLLDLYSIGLEEVRELAEDQKYNEALSAYRKYLANKLKTLNLEELSYTTGTFEEIITKADNLMENRISLLETDPIDIGDPINWFARPGDDDQWQSHLAYMYFQNCLIKAYEFTGNGVYLKKWCKILEDFIENHSLGVKGLEYDPVNPMYRNEYKYKCGGFRASGLG